MKRLMKSQLIIFGLIATMTSLNAATTAVALVESPKTSEHQGDSARVQTITKNIFIYEVMTRLKAALDRDHSKSDEVKMQLAGRKKQIIECSYNRIYTELLVAPNTKLELQSKSNILLAMISLISINLDEAITDNMESSQLVSKFNATFDEAYLKSEHPLFLFLQDLTIQVKRAIDTWSKALNAKSVFKVISNLEAFEINTSTVNAPISTIKITLQGTLYLLKDIRGCVPVYLNDLVIQEAKKFRKHAHFIPYYGNYKEGFLSRGFVIDPSGSLEKRPGVFIKCKNDDISIVVYGGCLDCNKSPCTQTMILMTKSLSILSNIASQGDEGQIPISKLFNYFDGFFVGNFTPFSDIEVTNKLLCNLSDCVMCQIKDKRLDTASYVLLSKLFAAFAENVDIEEQRQAEISKVCLQPEPKKKSRRKTKKSLEMIEKNEGCDRTSPKVDLHQHTSEVSKEQSAAPLVVQDDVVENLDSAELKDEGVSQQDVVLEDASDEEVEEKEMIEDSNSEKENSPSVTQAAETFTLETLHKGIYDKIMETVPGGRIKQKSLDRLIGLWLKMTGHPLEAFNVFVNGSHRNLHVQGKGFTVLKRHKADRTYAPGEVRELAQKFVALKE